jgi:multicomponent Na+:H+ antiporter subunit A
MIGWLLGFAFLGSCAAWPLSFLVGRRASGWLLALVPASLFVAFLDFVPAIAARRAITWRIAWAPSFGVDVALRLDGFSFLFALLITGIGALVVVYAGDYLSNESASSRARFFTLILLFMTAMLGAVSPTTCSSCFSSGQQRAFCRSCSSGSTPTARTRAAPR